MRQQRPRPYARSMRRPPAPRPKRTTTPLTSSQRTRGLLIMFILATSVLIMAEIAEHRNRPGLTHAAGWSTLRP